jgi:hypothetical protein
MPNSPGDAFAADECHESAAGFARMILFKIALGLLTGNKEIERFSQRLADLGRESHSPLYDKELSGMDIEGGFNQQDSEGFIKIHAIRLKAHNAIMTKLGKRVADRSFIRETLSVLALLLLDLGRFAGNFVIFASREFGFLILDDGIATSSSLMPQKKNPDFFELIRAGAGRLFGYFSRLFVTAKALPSTYDKVLQDDKVPLHQGLEDTARIL